MKTSATFVACMALSALLSANIGPFGFSSKCREFVPAVSDQFEKNALAISHDLLNGTWTSANDFTYHFLENGRMIRFEANAPSTTFFWWVETIGSLPVLGLQDESGVKNTWLVEQTCEGIVLKDVVGVNSFLLDHQPLAPSSITISTKTLLMGEWTNVSAFEMGHGQAAKGSYFGYFFNSDGSFVCSFGQTGNNQQLKGWWEISKDGRFLLLYPTSCASKDTINNILAMRLAHIDQHGLVLEPVMATDPVNDFFSSSNKRFAFVK